MILDLLGEGHGRKLLDVGAAQGYMAQILLRQGFQVTCVEGDPKLAKAAAAAGLDVIVADMDAELPALGGPFDVIVCGDLLEHLKDSLGALQSLTQQLSPDGLIVVSVPNVAHLWVRLQLLLGRFNYADRGILDRTHLRFFTRRTLEELFGDAGLEILQFAVTPVPLPLLVPERYHGRTLQFVHWISAALARAGKTMFAYQFVAKLKRMERS